MHVRHHVQQEWDSRITHFLPNWLWKIPNRFSNLQGNLCIMMLRQKRRSGFSQGLAALPKLFSLCLGLWMMYRVGKMLDPVHTWACSHVAMVHLWWGWCTHKQSLGWSHIPWDAWTQELVQQTQSGLDSSATKIVLNAYWISAFFRHCDHEQKRAWSPGSYMGRVWLFSSIDPLSSSNWPCFSNKQVFTQWKSCPQISRMHAPKLLAACALAWACVCACMHVNIRG